MPPRARIIALACLWAGAVCCVPGTSPAQDVAGRPAAQPAPQAEGTRSVPATWPPALGARGPRDQGVLPAAESSEASSGERSVPLPPATEPQARRQAESPGPAEGEAGAARRGREFHLPLPPPGSSKQADPNAVERPRGGLASALTVVSSLAVVLGLFLVLAWVMRRAAPRGSTLLPGEVVEVLGRAPLAGRHQVHLLRCGTKLLLVSVTPAGAETLTEITDQDEVNRLAGLCREAHPDSVTATFGQVFGQLSRQGSVLGLFGGARASEASPGSGGRDDGSVEGRHA